MRQTFRPLDSANKIIARRMPLPLPPPLHLHLHLHLHLPPIPIVVHQHQEDAVALRSTRSVLVRAPHVKLQLLRRLDDRLAADLDGLSVASDFG